MEVTKTDSKSEDLQALRNPKARRLRSLVWNDFVKEQKADGSYVAICNHCKKQLVASSRSGTTHLRNHLGTCLNSKKPMKRRKLHVRRLALKPYETSKGDSRNDGTNDAGDSHFDQDLSRYDLARMIVLHGYPFSIVDQIGFRTFIKNLQPRFKLVSCDTVKNDCMKIYEDARVKLHEEFDKLPCRVNVTVDTWRSNNDAEYLCLTCHYVDNDWKLCQKVVSFLQVEMTSTVEETSKIIIDNLYEWSIDQKLNSIVLDNTKNGDVVARELLKYFRLKETLCSNGDFFHVHSFQQILNLIIQDGLELAAKMTDRVRETVQYVNSSQEKMHLFQKAAKKVCAPNKSLYLDVPSKWTSTYMMLERACEFQEAFICLAEWDSEYGNALSSRDWNIVKAFVDCLEVFYNALGKISATKIPTANICFNDISAIHSLVKTWCTSHLPLIKSVACHMLSKFEEYWGMTRTMMAIASILDPRYKMKSIEYFSKLIYEHPDDAKRRTEIVHKCLVDLYNEYSAQTPGNQAYLCYAGIGGSYTNSSYGTAGETKNPSRTTLSDTRRGLDQYLQETSSNQPMKSDLDLYLEEAVHPSKEGLEDSFDVLAWWKFNAAKYPVLSAIARDILATPVSVVSLDIEERMLNEFLSSLDHMTIQALMCGQDWLRNEIEAGHMDSGSAMCLVPANALDSSPLMR